MLTDLVKRTRCYRRFDESVRVNVELLIKIIETLRFVSSARNAQPLKYIVSTDSRINERIFRTLKWAGYLTDWEGPKQGERPTAYIVILRDRKISTEDFALIDAGIAMQTAMLMLAEMGFGSCPIAAIDKEELSKILDIPANLEILIVLAIGKPTEKVVLIDAKGDDIKYFRDDKGFHYVPKRTIDEILIKKFA